MSTIVFPWVNEHRFKLGLGVVLRLSLFNLVISCSFLLVGQRSRKCFIFGLLYGTGYRFETSATQLYLSAQSGNGKEQEIQTKEQGGKRKELETNDKVSIYSVQVITGQLRWVLKPWLVLFKMGARTPTVLRNFGKYITSRHGLKSSKTLSFINSTVRTSNIAHTDHTKYEGCRKHTCSAPTRHSYFENLLAK